MIRYQGRKFRKRMEEEELNELIKESFGRSGFNNLIQSHMLSELCIYVNKTCNPQFSRLISTPKIRRSKVWIFAYSLMIKLLEQYQMSSTIKTFNFELKGAKIEYTFDLTSSILPSQVLLNYIRRQKRNQKRLSVRVSKFNYDKILLNDPTSDSKPPKSSNQRKKTD